MSSLPLDDRSPENLTVAFNGPDAHAIEIEAGSLGTWTFTYTAGDRGITQDGTLELWTTHTNVPCGYKIQADDPNGWDYCTVETTAAAQVEFSHLAALYKDHRFCEVRVTGGRVESGETISIRIGDERAGGHQSEAPAYSLEGLGFYAGVGHAGDGSVNILPIPLSVNIIPGPAAKLSATAPSVVAVDEPFALHVRAEDVNSNPGAGLEAELVVLDGERELGRAVLSAAQAGIIEIDGLTLGAVGVHRLLVHSADGRFEAMSNPIRCAAAPAARVYWGDMHAHADWADGAGTINWNHDFARNKARLDFYGLTEHIYGTPGNPITSIDKPPNLGPERLWRECQEAARAYHQPGRFVTFLGYERTPWERRRSSGDLTVWFMHDDADLIIEETIAQTIESVKAAGGDVFVGTHAAQRPDWKHYPDDVESVMPTIEISAMHQHAEWYLFEGLQRGHKFATVGMADEHCGHPGYDLWARFGQGGTPRRPFAVRSAVTAAMAPELTREAIRDAFFRKQTYATSGDRILVDLMMDGQEVGSSLTVAENPVLRVVVNGTATIERIDIIRGERLVHSEYPNALDAELAWADTAPRSSETWYYVRVTQANGGFAWSTPIWVRCERGNDSDTHLPLWCDVVWPPAPADRGPDRTTDLAEAARAFGEDPERFASLVQIGHFGDARGDYVLFRGRDGRDGVPIHVHLYDGFAAPRLYISRGWSDFGWVMNGLPKDDLPWPEPTGDWA